MDDSMDGSLEGVAPPVPEKITMGNSAFEVWLEELNRVARVKYGASTNLSDDTGESCWRDFYDDNYTPDEAIIEDMSNAD